MLGTTNADGTVQQTVMWYLFENDTIVMNTKAGRVKDRNIRRNPHISVCVQDGYNYVTVSGSADLIDDPAIAQADIYRLAVRYNGEETVKRMIAETFARELRVTIRMKCEHVIENLE